MATGDFDENGVPDLVVGSASSSGFSLSLYAGNEDVVFSHSPRARQLRSTGRLNGQPQLSVAGLFPVVEAPDFLATGDFNDDGHLDLATAARSGKALHLLLGDGHGDFHSVKGIQLAGRITAMGSNETADGNGCLPIAIGMVDDFGPAAVLFQSLDREPGTPAIIRLASEANALTFRRSVISNASYLLIAASRELLVAPTDLRGTETAKPVIYQHAFPFTIRSMAVGSFAGDSGSDVAVLTADGGVHVLAEVGSGDLSDESFTLGTWPRSTKVVRARISGSPTDDLLVLDPNSRRLHVLAQETKGATDSSTEPIEQNRLSVSIDIDSEPLAALPLRLSESALSGLVLLSAGQPSPATMVISAAMTFVVTNTDDAGAGSLRQAILDANGNVGLDTINFNIATPLPHVINLLSPLPAITETVTINGSSEPDFAGTPVVELNGLNAGFADGLTINAPSCVVRGLVINRFGVNGISIASSGNVIEGNFIGTNATGSFALGNTLEGVFISAGSVNMIGGTTTAARNLISGNRNGIELAGGSSNQVRGNFIGTDAAGTASIGNSTNGVLVSGSSGNAVGAIGSASKNTIAFNGGAGVAVTAGTGNSILSNAIFLNGGLGIDLGLAGVTPNDTGDGDSGANNLQNFPVLSSASAVGTSTAIEGTLNSTPSTTFRLEFFSNQAPNPSGFGEGQTFISALTVTTDGAGNASFNSTFPVTVAPGQIVTATATDPANNTSEFSKAIQVGGLTGGTPADLTVITSIAPNPVEAGSQITKTIIVSNAGPATATSVTVTDVLSANTTFVSCNSTSGGVCGGVGNNRTITFASLPPGTTAVITIVAGVNCSVPNGTIIGNTAVVFSSSTPDTNPGNNVGTATTLATNPAPRIVCPGNIVRSNDLGQCTATITFLTQATDNCPGTTVVCSPPSGSSFAIGTTTVNCVATDAAGATANCSFTVTVNDIEPLVLTCPANVAVSATPGNCTPVVNFSAPTISDNCPGASVTCVPASGSAFPIGVTNVLCTARDQSGTQATCGFTVTVTGPPQPILTLEGNGTALEFGPVPAERKPKKLKKQRSRNFSIENAGCIPLVLTFESILRVGNDVDRGRISDPDDRAVFTLFRVDANGVETELDSLANVSVAPGQQQNFKVRFHPLLPRVVNDTRGLRAADVIPDVINSVLTMGSNAGQPIRINLVGRVNPALQLINPENPRKSPRVVFSRAGDEFVIEYSIHDPNLDVRTSRFQFFDREGRPAESPIDVDLRQLVQSRGFVRGQSFTLVQRISGADDHEGIVGVTVTVSDSESSDSDASSFSPVAASSRKRPEYIASRISPSDKSLYAFPPLSSRFYDRRSSFAGKEGE